MKQVYKAPEIMLFKVAPQDVIATSGGDNRLEWDTTED